jgi:hypothetical protein
MNTVGIDAGTLREFLPLIFADIPQAATHFILNFLRFLAQSTR